MAWTFDITGPNGGANLATAVPFKSAKLSWSIDGPGSVEIDLNKDDVSTFWTPGLHRVVAKESATTWIAAYVTELSRDGSPSDVRYKASGLGLASILDMRIVRHEFVIVDNLNDIVTNLLAEAQGQTDGNMNFTMGTQTGTFVSRRRTYCMGTVVGDAIRELSGIGAGFDWEVDGSGNLNMWAPSRGVATGRTLAPEDVQDWSITLDTSELVTTVTAIGDQNRPWGAVSRLAKSGFAATYGRHEVVVDLDSNDTDDLDEAAYAVLAVNGGAVLRVHATWIDGIGPWAWGAVWLDDLVTVTLDDWFGPDQSMRCIAVSITLEPGTHAFVEYEFEALVASIAPDLVEDQGVVSSVTTPGQIILTGGS